MSTAEYLTPGEAREVKLPLLPWRRHRTVENEIGRMGLVNQMAWMNVVFPFRISGRDDLVRMAEIRQQMETEPEIEFPSITVEGE